MLSPAPATALRARIAPRVDAFDAHAWDALVAPSGLRHAALAALDDARVEAGALYALVHDEAGPFAAISARPLGATPLLRRVLQLAPQVGGRSEGVQLRAGTTLTDALPRLVPIFARMARRQGCLAYAVGAEAPERDAFGDAGFAVFDAPPNNRTDLGRFASYDALRAALPRKGHDLARACRRSERFGVRFEVTSPPRADDARLHALLRATYAAHGERLVYSSELFPRLWRSGFSEQVLVSAFVGDRLVSADWCFRDRDRLVVSFAALDYAVAPESYAYFSSMDRILRWAFEHGVRTLEWGLSNDEIKRRYGGAETVPLYAAVRLAAPMPERAWRLVRAVLTSPVTARALGIDGEQARPRAGGRNDGVSASA